MTATPHANLIPYNIDSYKTNVRNILPAQELRDKFARVLARLGIYEILISCP